MYSVFLTELLKVAGAMYISEDREESSCKHFSPSWGEGPLQAAIYALKNGLVEESRDSRFTAFSVL